MLFYRSSLPLSRSTLDYVTRLIRRHRTKLRSKGRALPPGKQALMTVAYLKNGETFAQLAAGFGVGTTTAWRYINETVTLLSARSPGLERALAKAKKDQLRHLVLDGTLIAIDRLAADRPFYSGKHKKHGVNLQVIAGPDGQVVWVSGAGPHILTPYKGKDKPETQKRANRSHAKLRGPGERANAQLKSWKILARLRCCPHRAGHLAKAIHVLHNREAAIAA